MKSSKTTGLRYWMQGVLEECDRAAAGFAVDPVHDLRVALRRCRSLADGMIAMDPDPNWKDMKKAGKRLFQRLGDLRDVQIMMEWIDKLHPAPVGRILLSVGTVSGKVGEGNSNPQQAATENQDHEPVRDPAAQALLAVLAHRESEHKREARAALDSFDRKQWRQWAKSLPQRAARIRPGSAVFKHLALERWTTARDLHARAMRNRSQVALHTLRIGIKRFRYIVENFLPAEHKAWSGDLKHMQDLLGEVHDLDVLWATALSGHIFSDAVARKNWHDIILRERSKRVDEYRAATVGEKSLWNLWRAGLPQGKQIQQLATRRMRLWASMLDPDIAHSERVARLSLELYDGLQSSGLLSAPESNGVPSDSRASLYAAALLHDVGKAAGNKGHHKESLHLIQKHGTPLGWNAADISRAAIVARFHCGALPSRGHKLLRDLLPAEQKATIQLAAVLRLANALDASHDGHIRRIKIENTAPAPRRTNGFLRKPTGLAKNEALIIAAEGYSPANPAARAIAAERFLLETVLRRPVVLKAMKPPGSS